MTTAKETCPHCGLTPDVGYGGTPLCAEAWSGSPEARPYYPHCVLQSRTRYHAIPVATDEFADSRPNVMRLLAGITAYPYVLNIHPTLLMGFV